MAKTKKHVGDVLGLSTARVRASAPRGTKHRRGSPKGIEVSPARHHTKRAGVVGGIRGRGR
ncbi:MAG: hypothetical protein EHM55_22245 [Acidobacteria bacterium]|nr:MAG: hypothetical protein EHM55_22245 [Acidobacteriota bacterium]